MAVKGRSDAGAAYGRIGHSIPRVEDLRLLVGRGKFTDDVAAPSALHAVFVRSPHAHARILAIDPAAALRLGAVAVFTGGDLVAAGVEPIFNPSDSLGGGYPSYDDRMRIPPWQALAVGKARHVGEAVALVVAPSEPLARDAAEAVVVEYETLPAVTDVAVADAPGAPLVWEDLPENRLFAVEAGDREETEAAFARAAHVVEIEVVNNRVIVCFLEPRGCIARYEEKTGRLSVHIGSQGVHQQAMRVAHALGLPRERVRVTTGDVGGGFGSRATTYPEYLAISHAAYALKCAVRWRAERAESFISDAQARDHVTSGALALDRDGRIIGLRVKGRCCMGAHVGPRQPASTIGNVIRMLCGAYAIPAAWLDFKGFVTNTVPINVYRGVGRFEDIYLLERLLDRAAPLVDIDRAEIRRRNLVPPSSMPWTTPTGSVLDCGEFPRLLDAALDYADWAGFPVRREDAAGRGRLRGIGVSYVVEGAGGMAEEYAMVDVKADGTIVLGTGAQSQGQGHETTFAQLAADELDLPFESIRVVSGDTDVVVDGVGTFASRSMIKAGGAAVEAITALIEKGRVRAGDRLEAPLEDIAYEGGRFRVVGTDRSISIAELAEDSPLAADAHHRNDLVAWPNGCHVCEVEIDPDTGWVTVVRYVAVDDVGRAVNPMIVDGQTIGAVVQGLGQALIERCVYDPQSGQLLSGSFMDYALPRAQDLPSIETWLDDVPTGTNALGVKGAGEAGTVAAPCAAISAVLDALAPLGITDLDMPAVPERVWAAINAARH